jgi:FixJ family two-component response regulator
LNVSLHDVVCIVDDDDAVRDSLSTLLESYELTVRTYESAVAFLRDTSRPQTGWIILDLHMPEMGGLELLEHLRRSGALYKVIVATGRGDVGLRESVLRAGADAMLDKPIDGNALARKILSAPAT